MVANGQPTRTDFTSQTEALRKAHARIKAEEDRCDPQDSLALSLQRFDAIVARQERDAAVLALAADLGPRYSPQRAALSTFRAANDQQKATLARLRALAAALGPFVAGGGGLVFFGPVGTGKDHLLAAMLYEAARLRLRCRWVNGQEAYGRIRDRMDAGLEEEEFFGDLCRPDVLAVSDPIPPVGGPSAWNVAQLYRLLDRRYRLLKPTWVSLNAVSAEDADAKLSAPVFDRLREGAELFPCFWASYRRPVGGA